jgi:hypothetical protein
MLKLFFNRFSKVVYTVEIVGIVFVILNIQKIITQSSSKISKRIFFLWVLMYAFMRFCSMVRWHVDSTRDAGIEVHFKKALVPTAYIMATLGIIFYVLPYVFVSIIGILLLSVMFSVNLVLIYMYILDRDQTPTNFYTHNDYIKFTNDYT